MLFIVFQLGQERYGLEATRVVEIVPLLPLRNLPQTPRGVAGFFQYRGQAVPALDLSQLTVGQPSREQLSTRILIVGYTDSQGRNQLLGLIAERATEVMRRGPAELAQAESRLGASPGLGPMLMDPQGPIQWLQIPRLLSPALRALLAEHPTEVPS